MTDFVSIPRNVVRKAIEEKEEAARMERPTGAVIFRGDGGGGDGGIVSSGHDAPVGPVGEGDTIHAEAMAIGSVPVGENLEGTSMLILTDNFHGGTGVSEPCNRCKVLIKACQIGTVYYVDDR